MITLHLLIKIDKSIVCKTRVWLRSDLLIWANRGYKKTDGVFLSLLFFFYLFSNLSQIKGVVEKKNVVELIWKWVASLTNETKTSIEVPTFSWRHYTWVKELFHIDYDRGCSFGECVNTCFLIWNFWERITFWWFFFSI